MLLKKSESRLIVGYGHGEYGFLNWLERDKKSVRELKNALSKRKVFRTIRLGPEWADNVEVGQLVYISVSDRPSEPRIISQCFVISASKVIFGNLKDADLIANIGAKTTDKAMREIERFYGRGPIDVYGSVVSILELKEFDA